ncbi:hypothetical protein KSE_20790 [Kitasatospora setae KM-6054]|uniref:Uncharacterized protein n=1 Tax=Kitasatospora setae (strain ATCC 33774 / DSM 43861 / JCM 3304 / KCC A-0304 / NBRC 14216 / KM-6054) TaxID=452652 RepID=E4N9M1_KITSK|nr:hypothetical protein KSE_20790 [Kitasatospora setae KM-6054]
MALCAVAAVGTVAVVLVPATAPETSSGDAALLSVVVNGGRTVELGAAESRTVTVEVTARDRSGIRAVEPIGLWGPNYAALKVGPMSCVPLDPAGTTARCGGEATVASSSRTLFDDQAGTWFVDLRIRANDGDRYLSKNAAGFSLKRAARIDDARVDDAAEGAAGAAAGRAVTVRGRLLRADWDRKADVPQYGAGAYLQFRPAGGDTWTTVASTGADSGGLLSVTVPVRGPGAFQWYAPGDKWTAGALSAELPLAVDGPAAHPGQ